MHCHNIKWVWMICSVVVAALVFVLLGTGLAYAWTTVGNGIEYEQVVLPDPNHVYVARMLSSNPAATIESSLPQGKLTGDKETVKLQSARLDDAINWWGKSWGQRNDVVVAINGDWTYLDSGPTYGFMYGGQVHSGWFAKGMYCEFGGKQFAWTHSRVPFVGGALMTGVTESLSVTANGATQTANGVNRARGTNELIIFTPQYDSDTNTDSSGVEVLVEMVEPSQITPIPGVTTGYVREIRASLGSTPIPFDHVVLSASGTAATTLLSNISIGAEVGISQQVDLGEAPHFNWADSYASVRGGRLLVKSGAVVDNTLSGDAFYTTRQPRTAVGYNDTYVFFVVCDGRSTASVGMTAMEMSNFFKDTLGATYAMDLDSGGSSTMVLNGVVQNVPSDGSERAIGNGLMMVNILPKGESSTYTPGQSVATTGSANLRLGPGTNYLPRTVMPVGSVGAIVDHSLKGVYAKGGYWWKVNFAGVVGWVSESLLGLQSTAPTVTINQASGQSDPTNASPINFTVVFSESVSDFATGDVTITGTAGGTKTATVTGSGTTYNVAVTGMTSGTLIASLAAGVAHDVSGDASAASTSTDNTVTYDSTVPTVTINQAAAQADPTGVSPINFTVVFSESVTDFTTGDVTITGTAGGSKTATVTGSGTTYNVAVSGMTNGTVIASLAAGVAHDAAGNASVASTSTDNTVTYSNATPTQFSETWESYTNASTPYGSWALQSGTWGGISSPGFSGGKRYSVPAGLQSRIVRPIDLDSHTHVVLQGWLQDSAGKNRGVLGLGRSATATDSTIIRIGAGGADAYTIQYYEGSTLTTVNTGLPVEAGWHFVRLDISYDGNVDNLWNVTYRVWNTAQTVENKGSFTWHFDRVNCNYVTLGAAAATTAAVAWDDIKVGSLADVGESPTIPETNLLTIDNSILHLEVDLAAGGAISYLSQSGSDRNLVNTYDRGRFVQQSYYAGDNIDRLSEGQHPSWSPWNWNPISVGDAFGNSSQILSYSSEANSIYVKTHPLLWDMNNEPAECDFETWISLNGSSAHIRNKLTCFRTDTRWTSVPRHQELPAVYTIADLHHLYTYQGDNPWAQESLNEIVGSQPPSPWYYWTTPEHWAAHVDDSGWGVGVYNPGSTLFVGGLFGTPAGGDTSSSTGYISPLDTQAFGPNTVFEYEADLIIGSLDEIRTWVYGTHDKIAPTVTINQVSSQVDPTGVSPINFTVVFSESVTDFVTGDVTITGTAGGSKTATVTGSSTTYNVAVSGMTSGTVIADLAAGVAHDAAGNASVASSSTDNLVTYDNTAPTITINQASSQVDPTGVSPINFTVVFSESVTDFVTGDVTITGTAGGSKTATVTGSGTTYNVAVSGMASGTVIADLAAGVARDAAGNASVASSSTDNTVTFLILRSITANVTLKSWTAASVVTMPFQVKYRKSGTLDTPTVVDMNLSVTPGGGVGTASLSLTDLAPGVYDVWVKCTHWLAGKLTSADVSASDSTGKIILLTNADINGDNVVNFSDYLLLQTQYKKTPGSPSADLNGDGKVDFSDYLILQAAYKQMGATL